MTEYTGMYADREDPHFNTHIVGKRIVKYGNQFSL